MGAAPSANVTKPLSAPHVTPILDTGDGDITLNFSWDPGQEEHLIFRGSTEASVTNTGWSATLTIDATGGTYTMSDDGGTDNTSAIAFDATAAEVAAALNALPDSVGANGYQYEVTGSAGGPYVIKPIGYNAHWDSFTLTTNPASLTGGAGTATLVETAGETQLDWGGAQEGSYHDGVPTGDGTTYYYGVRAGTYSAASWESMGWSDVTVVKVKSWIVPSTQGAANINVVQSVPVPTA